MALTLSSKSLARTMARLSPPVIAGAAAIYTCDALNRVPVERPSSLSRPGRPLLAVALGTASTIVAARLNPVKYNIVNHALMGVVGGSLTSLFVMVGNAERSDLRQTP